jgi:phosphonate transport system substrate-binding protein
MSVRYLAAALALAPTLAFAQGQKPEPVQPPVTIGQEVPLQKPGAGEPELPPQPKGRPLRIGVVPSLGKGAEGESERLASYLAKELGQKVQSELFDNHDAEANALVAGRIDFAWMPPLQAFNASIGGAQLLTKLVREGASTYRSVFFVRADSPVKTLEDLKGKTVGWVEANSATGHVFPLAMLARAKLNPGALFKEQKYLGSHDGVCKAVWDKKIDVGATLADEPPLNGKLAVTGCQHTLGANAEKLRVLAVSEPVPNDVIAVRKGLDPKLVEKLRTVVLAMPNNKDGKAILKDSLKADGVTALQPGDMDPVQHALEAAADVE